MVLYLFGGPSLSTIGLLPVKLKAALYVLSVVVLAQEVTAERQLSNEYIPSFFNDLCLLA